MYMCVKVYCSYTYMYIYKYGDFTVFILKNSIQYIFLYMVISLFSNYIYTCKHIYFCVQYLLFLSFVQSSLLTLIYTHLKEWKENCNMHNAFVAIVKTWNNFKLLSFWSCLAISVDVLLYALKKCSQQEQVTHFKWQHIKHNHVSNVFFKWVQLFLSKP